MVAGEASGDQLASLLLQGVASRWPGLSSFGIGGPGMVAQGFQPWWPSEKLSVFGYLDALRHYRELVGIRQQLQQRLLADPPELFIGVDAPDFNFGLEQPLRAAGVRTVHFVCPSIWAWRGSRVRKLAAAADHVLCLFPFEPELLARHGIQASFVGHPVADRIALQPDQAAARRQLGLDATDTVVALLPGSRRSELKLIGPAMLQAAALMARQRSGLRFVLPIAPGMQTLVDAALDTLAPADRARLDLLQLEGRSHEVLAACDVTLIASGTATLEAALFKRPMVIVYRLARLNAMLMKRMAYLPWVGLPNVLLRDFAVPELMQEAMTPEAMARETLAWLDDAPRRDRLQQRFTELHLSLRQDTAQKAGDVIAKLLHA